MTFTREREHANTMLHSLVKSQPQKLTLSFAHQCLIVSDHMASYHTWKHDLRDVQSRVQGGNRNFPNLN